MSRRILIGSRSFGATFPEHLEALVAAGFEVIPNDRGRAYRAAELLERLGSVDAIVTGTDELTAEVIASASRLKLIAKHGVGLDNVDLEAAREAGVVVSATTGAMHDSVADLTLALLLAVARSVVPAHASVAAGEWRPSTGMELRGRILGLVGLGRIGREVALRAQAFGMVVRAHDPYPDVEWATAHDVALSELEDIVSGADVISLHAPGGGGPLLDARRIAAMRPGAIVLNTSRGALVDEAALADALREGRLGGAGLDVFADEPPEGSPLLGLDTVVLTPHIGGRTADAQRRMGELCVASCVETLKDAR